MVARLVLLCQLRLLSYTDLIVIKRNNFLFLAGVAITVLLKGGEWMGSGVVGPEELESG